MRVSFTFLLAVCAPLLALAAPIVITPSKSDGTSSTEIYAPGWKRDDTVHELISPVDWKRGGSSDTDGASVPGWKRDGTTNTDGMGSPNWKRDGVSDIKGIRVPGWKRDGSSDPDGAVSQNWKRDDLSKPEYAGSKSWKRDGTSSPLGGPGTKDWKA